MISLRDGLEAYLTQRQNLGFKFQKQSVRLFQFVEFMEKRKASNITIPLAMEWATRSPGHLPMWSINMTDVRGFSKYLNAIDSRHEVPPVGLIPPSGHCKPYLYKKKDITRLLAEAKALPPVKGLRRWTYQCLIGLLSVTGMRISEAVALTRTDVDLKNGILTIKNSKSGQSRLIPLHRSTTKILEQYSLKRDKHMTTSRSEYFFVAEKGGKLWPANIYPIFNQLCEKIGLEGTTASSRPRLIDFRHSFAVATILRWYRNGQNVENRLPALSTFMGHTCV